MKKIVRARSVQRKKESDRWDSKALSEINQRPQDTLYRAAAAPTGRREPDEGLKDRIAPEDEPPRTRVSTTREMKVTLDDIKKYGFTEVGCDRCDFIKEHGHAKGCGHAHSLVCRERIRQARVDYGAMMARESSLRVR